MAEAERSAQGERASRPAVARRAEPSRDEARLTAWVAGWFSRVEDLVYIGLAVILAVLAVGLLIEGGVMLTRAITNRELGVQVATLLDRALLVLMIVEILYTVQVSLREHTLVPEPFLVVALIAAIRRILVLTAEFSTILEEGGDAFRNAMIELGVLAGLVLALVVAVTLLRRRATMPATER